MGYYKRKKYYKEQKYDNTDEGIAVLIIWAIFCIVTFVKKNIATIIICLLGIILVLIFAFLFIIYKKNQKTKKENIFENLDLYKNIIALNNKYNLKPLNIFYDNYRVQFKSNLKTCNIDDYLLMTIHNKYDKLKNYKMKYDTLKPRYERYEKEYEELRKYINVDEAKKLKIREEDYNAKQLQIFEDNKIRLDVRFTVVIYINYKSKNGYVQDKVYKRYNSDEFSKIMTEYLNLRKNNQLASIESRIERSKMCESLRYDVLKRDNSTCQMCGATKDDGVTLHVDHIIPISKGGKTEMDNLQTLCSRCNIGKSAKL